MKKIYYSLCLVLVLGINARLSAQTDPGIANLTHQWTFDDGTTKDYVGGADGTLAGAATVSSKALSTADGGWMEMPGADIAVNTYSELTVEAWFTSKSGANSGCTMLSYFGNTTGSYGTDYIFMTPAGCSGGRLAISCGNTSSPWTVENGITYSGGRIDDGLVHQLVATFTGTDMVFYLDGVNIGTIAYTGSNALSALGTQFAYLGRGGYTGDPTWKGKVHKYSMYNKALSDEEILYLFQQGAESTPVVSASIGSIALDENYPAEAFTVSSSNLSTDITVTAPAGILVSPTTITANTNDVSVIAFFDGSTIVDGNIELTSGATTVTIPVKTASDAACYVPLYADMVNIITDPGCNNLASFGGWGGRQPLTIVTAPDSVYCGAASIMVGNGTSTGSGSLDFVLTGKIEPNTSYRVKAMVKTLDGTFQLGVWGYEDGKSDINNVIDTQGEWKPLDFVFTTGATLGGTQGMFWNNWACTGTAGLIDNWEMYIYNDPVINTSVKDLAYDPEYLSSTFTVSATNLVDDLTITAPAGITVSPTTIPASASTDVTVTVTYDGTTPVNGNITLSSGSASENVLVVTTTASNTTCFSPLYTDKTNLIPDPYFNDPTKFAGWGAKSFASIATVPDSIYCGSHSGFIPGNCGGSFDVSLVDVIKPSTMYVARVMMKTVGYFQLGVGGIDVNGGNGDVNNVVDTHGAWEAVTLEFSTGDSLRVGSQPLFINSCIAVDSTHAQGTRAYADNWELYELGPVTAVRNVFNQINNVYVKSGKIIAEFDATNNSQVQLSVYTIQGAMVADERFTPYIGRNSRMMEATLPSGMYVVRLTQNGQSSFKKIIK